MKCIVLVSGTLPDFRWLKWDKSITSLRRSENFINGSYKLIDPTYYTTIQDGQNYGVELRITNVTEDDFGLYTCVVSNHIGKDHSSAFLSRYIKPTRPTKGSKYIVSLDASAFWFVTNFVILCTICCCPTAYDPQGTHDHCLPPHFGTVAFSVEKVHAYFPSIAFDNGGNDCWVKNVINEKIL